MPWPPRARAPPRPTRASRRKGREEGGIEDGGASRRTGAEIEIAAIIYAFPPPAPSTAAVEKGLAAVLAEYRAFAGQLGEAPDGTPALLLNDRRALRGGSRGRRSRGHGVRQAHPGAAAPAPGPRGGPPGGAARSTELRRGGHDGGGGARRRTMAGPAAVPWGPRLAASSAGLDGLGGWRARRPGRPRWAACSSLAPVQQLAPPSSLPLSWLARAGRGGGARARRGHGVRLRPPPRRQREDRGEVVAHLSVRERERRW